MANRIPSGIGREQVIAALRDLDAGAPHAFGDSTGYDVLYEGRRYPPKAVIGVAAGKVLEAPLAPYDFKGGLGSKCFRILEDLGFSIASKGDTHPFPDEVPVGSPHVEGATQQVTVNRYERDEAARREAIRHHGATCCVCGRDFAKTYGAIGDGFIHVHHLVALAQIRAAYVVNPVTDLVPVCPNCHAMLHKRVPPFTVEELRVIMGAKSA